MLDGVDATEQDGGRTVTDHRRVDRGPSAGDRAAPAACPSARRRARGPDRGDGRGPGVDSPGLGAGSALRGRSVTPGRAARPRSARAGSGEPGGVRKVCAALARPTPAPPAQRASAAAPRRGGRGHMCSACNLVTCLAGSHDIVHRMPHAAAGGRSMAGGTSSCRDRLC